MKKNFIYNDSIITDFVKYGKKLTIKFDFVYNNSNSSFSNPFDNLFSTNIILTIYSNGEFETRGYFWCNENHQRSFAG